MFLLDTDTVNLILARSGSPYAAVESRLVRHDPATVFVPIVSFQELFAGWQAYLKRAKSAEQIVRAYDRFAAVLQEFQNWRVAPYDESAAAIFKSLRQQKVRIGTLDLRIASIALAQGWIVVSRNLVDFERVPGLHVEDWSTPLPDKPK